MLDELFLTHVYECLNQNIVCFGRKWPWHTRYDDFITRLTILKRGSYQINIAVWKNC